ncbi:hypothetical protein [Carnobacterium maltaromaticum]|uniref:hypothetical protein n=1 Tax=Carnobacterium maltaromaticum TaxID=2751 RepID=UPI0012F7D3CB|nr:hypothetical protein [Carnobacterium maltaromaticum]
MNEELMLKLLKEQQKTNELLQTIVSSLEQKTSIKMSTKECAKVIASLQEYNPRRTGVKEDREQK